MSFSNLLLRLFRLLFLGIYVGYLLHVGLLLLLLPWSAFWPFLVFRLPPHLWLLFDSPLLRGMICAFGVLHLLLLTKELLTAPRPEN